jgi:flagellin-specific chaperone FliS
MAASPPGPIATYSRMQIETASHARLVCILHEQCSLRLRQARQTAGSRRVLLDNIQNMLIVLQQSVKKTDATSRTLLHLYDYCYCLLEEEGSAGIDNVISIIDPLRQTFDHLQKHPG